MTGRVADGVLADEDPVEVPVKRPDDDESPVKPPAEEVVVGRLLLENETPDTLDVELDAEPDTMTNEKTIGYVKPPTEAWTFTVPMTTCGWKVDGTWIKRVLAPVAGLLIGVIQLTRGTVVMETTISVGSLR